MFNNKRQSLNIPYEYERKIARSNRFESTEETIAYDKMKQMRLVERQKVIEDGLILYPSASTILNQAIDFRGSCESMCPEFEIVERKNQTSIGPIELSKIGAVDMQKVVKAYRRSAADSEQPLPCDVRSTSALTGYIRGYVHHWYQRVILSKTDPFHPLAKVNHTTFHYDEDGLEDHMRDAQPDLPQELLML